MQSRTTASSQAVRQITLGNDSEQRNLQKQRQVNCWIAQAYFKLNIFSQM
jgi:hypothetical protein